MKHIALKMRILFILLITFLQHSDQTLVRRKWFEIDNRLFRVDPDGQYTWKQAIKECKNEHVHLIQPPIDYDYSKLLGAIKRNFQNYSSFWTSGIVNHTSTLDSLGLGKSKANQKKCKKFANTTFFEYKPDDCNKLYGFICERSLLIEFSKFEDNEYEYHIEPLKQFNCYEAYNECSKKYMSLRPLKDHFNHKMLQEYIFYNYGPSHQFWLDDGNNDCTTINRSNQTFNLQTKLGFICERRKLKSTLSTRHLILIIFLSLTTIGAIFVYIIGRCCFSKNKEDRYLVKAVYSKNCKNTEPE